MNTTPLFQTDPVVFEVIQSSFYSICEEMKSVIVRAAFSSALNLSADLSCALLDGEGYVVAQGNDIPVHLGAMTFTAHGVFKKIPREEMNPGDAILTNDVYCGGTHLPDMSLITPIFVDNRILCFAASRVHWPDVGGAAVGSASVTDDIIKEGIRIPAVKIVEGGRFNKSTLDIIMANVRLPIERIGDLKAQFAGNLRAVQRIQGLINKYGESTIRRVLSDVQDYSELLLRESLKVIPDGTYENTELLDGDGFEPEGDENPKRICVQIDKSGTEIIFDFTGTSTCARGPINAPIAVTASSIYYVVMAMAGSGIPVNSGCHRPIRIVAKGGTLVNATYPAPVVAANTETSNRLVDILLGAFAKIIPERVIAGSYGSGGVFTLGGWDPIRNKGFVHYETVGGGMGARHNADGLNGLRVHMGNTMNIPVEAIEATLPVLVTEYELIPNSGGDGRFRGGSGVRKVIRSLVNGINISVLGERTLSPAYGVNGGGIGSTAKFTIRKPDNKLEILPSKTIVRKLDEGDELCIETAGGGGYGEPIDQEWEEKSTGVKDRLIKQQEKIICLPKNERWGVNVLNIKNEYQKNENDRRRIGILVPSSNTIMENDLHDHLPKQHYTVHAARMYLEETTPAAEKQMIEQFSELAAEQLKTLYPHLLVFGCTSAGSLFGPEYDQEITSRLGQIAGSPCIGVLSCVVDSLKRRNAKRVAVLTPYIDDLNSTIQGSLEQSGFEVVEIHGKGIDVNFELAQEGPEDIFQFAKDKLNGMNADTLFISCTNYRALEIQKRLQKEFSIPVVTSNSAVLEGITHYFTNLKITTTEDLRRKFLL
jgi:N-methylhydantoinase B